MTAPALWLATALAALCLWSSPAGAWVARILSVVMLVFVVAPAMAGEVACPSKSVACWKVRAAATAFGEAAVEAHARACGWGQAEIAAVRQRCLKAKPGQGSGS
jgi:hypothetical protein